MTHDRAFLPRALAAAVLLLGAALLAVAAACVAYLGYSGWRGPPASEVPGAPAPGADSDAMGTAVAVVGALASLGLGYSLWSLGRRLPGAPEALRVRE